MQAVAGDAGSHATLVIGLPADDVAGVFGDQRQLAIADVGAIDIEYFGVASVMAKQDVIGIVFQVVFDTGPHTRKGRSEEHTSELQSLMRISYAVFCLKKKKQKQTTHRCNT